MLYRAKDRDQQVTPDHWANWLQLHGSYFDEALNRKIPYRITHTKLGLLLMYFAGMISGLLGIGSGALKVPAMDIAMRIPIKVSTATSNFMIGVTAAASAGVYFSRGDIDPVIAAPVAIGVVLGAAIGSKVLSKADNRLIRLLFVIVLLIIATQMIWKGLQ